MRITQMRAKTTVISEGLEAHDAEVQIEGMKGRRMAVLYVHVNDFQQRHYTLADKSMFEFLTGQTEEAEPVEFLEEHENLASAQLSEYAEFYETADRMIDALSQWQY